MFNLKSRTEKGILAVAIAGMLLPTMALGQSFSMSLGGDLSPLGRDNSAVLPPAINAPGVVINNRNQQVFEPDTASIAAPNCNVPTEYEYQSGYQDDHHLGPDGPGSDSKANLFYFPPADCSTNSTPAPVFVWFHGGGFIVGSANHVADNVPIAEQPADFFYKQNQISGQWEAKNTLKALFRELINEGFAVVSVNYPLAYTTEAGYHNGNQEQTDKALAYSYAGMAIKWLRSHASTLGINPNMVAVGGHSAGAMITSHLVFTAGLDSDEVPDAALINRGPFSIAGLNEAGEPQSTGGTHPANTDALYGDCVEFFKDLPFSNGLFKNPNSNQTGWCPAFTMAPDSIASFSQNVHYYNEVNNLAGRKTNLLNVDHMPVVFAFRDETDDQVVMPLDEFGQANPNGFPMRIEPNQSDCNGYTTKECRTTILSTFNVFGSSAPSNRVVFNGTANLNSQFLDTPYNASPMFAELGGTMTWFKGATFDVVDWASIGTVLAWDSYPGFDSYFAPGETPSFAKLALEGIGWNDAHSEWHYDGSKTNPNLIGDRPESYKEAMIVAGWTEYTSPVGSFANGSGGYARVDVEGDQDIVANDSHLVIDYFKAAFGL